MKILSEIKLAIAEKYQYSIKKRNNIECADGIYKNGIYIVPQALSKLEVEEVEKACLSAMDSYPEYVVLESNGSDRRMYGIDRVIDVPLLKSLGEKFRTFARDFYGVNKVEFFCMFGEIKSTSNNIGSGSGWHRDSPFRHQFKAIIYLSDVDKNNGAFEFIPTSHAYQNIKTVSVNLGCQLNSDRFSVVEVEKLIANKTLEPIKEVLGSAGSILFADTRGLHRGKPLASGLRRAITFYFYAKKIPDHFVLPPKKYYD